MGEVRKKGGKLIKGVLRIRLLLWVIEVQFCRLSSKELCRRHLRIVSPWEREAGLFIQ